MSSSTDGEDHEKDSPGFFMASTMKSMQMKFPSVKNLATQVLAQWLQDPTTRTTAILDCRPQTEYVVSHLQGAKRVDYKSADIPALDEQLQEDFNGKPYPTVVCYCSVGYRSSVVAKNLQDFYKETRRGPVPEIYNLSGSIFKWANEGRPMVNIQGNPTKFAHPYTSFWGRLLNSDLRRDSV